MDAAPTVRRRQEADAASQMAAPTTMGAMQSACSHGTLGPLAANPLYRGRLVAATGQSHRGDRITGVCPSSSLVGRESEFRIQSDVPRVGDAVGRPARRRDSRMTAC